MRWRGLQIAVWLVVGAASVSAWALTLNPKAWSKSGSAVVGKTSTGDLTVALPTWPSTLHYAWTLPPGPLVGTLTGTLQMVTTGAPLFVWDTEGNPCATPATVRPFFGRWSQHGPRRIEYADRWWPPAVSYPLGAGETVFSVPIEQSQWTGVQFTGLPDVQAFALAAADPDMLGFSFGGGCFYGHGVGVQGGTALLLVSQITVD